jgi:hypothetical protein
MKRLWQICAIAFANLASVQWAVVIVPRLDSVFAEAETEYIALAGRESDYRQFQTNHRHQGRRWTAAEDARITADARPLDRKLSETLGRSVQAIQRQRSRLT